MAPAWFLFQAVTVELPTQQRLRSAVTVTLGDRQQKKASEGRSCRNIRWEPDEDWYRGLYLSDMAHNLMVYLGKLQLVVSLRCYGGVIVLSRAHAKRRLTETRSFLPHTITSPVCNDICLTTVFNSNWLQWLNVVPMVRLYMTTCLKIKDAKL